VYAKERRLIEIVKAELQMGRRCCHVYAVYTRKRDVTRRPGEHSGGGKGSM